MAKWLFGMLDRSAWTNTYLFAGVCDGLGHARGQATKALPLVSTLEMEMFFVANTWLTRSAATSATTVSALFSGGLPSVFSGKRAAGSKVGLTNLGNTCYVNSTMQALFSIRSFRNAIHGAFALPFYQIALIFP
jgi:hypothetical protein